MLELFANLHNAQCKGVRFPQNDTITHNSKLPWTLKRLLDYPGEIFFIRIWIFLSAKTKKFRVGVLKQTMPGFSSVVPAPGVAVALAESRVTMRPWPCWKNKKIHFLMNYEL